MLFTYQTDAYLINEIYKGKHNAFQELVKRYYKKAFNIAWRELFSKEDAEDVVQIVFLKIWQRPDLFDKNKNTKFSTWFYRVLINACIDLKRGNNKTETINIIELKDKRNSFDDKYLNQHIIAALKKLPDAQRNIINLFYYEELSTKETANIMKITPKAVEAHLRRARDNLKGLIDKNFWSEKYE